LQTQHKGRREEKWRRGVSLGALGRCQAGPSPNPKLIPVLFPLHFLLFLGSSEHSLTCPGLWEEAIVVVGELGLNGFICVKV
jgi:hypothetical protein